MSRFTMGVAATVAAVCSGADTASAELVLLGGAPTDSFVQFWTYNGTGPATIDTVIESISQTAGPNGPSTQSGWIGVEFHGGWTTPSLSNTVVVGDGPLGSPAFFDIHVENPPKAVVTLRFWGHQNGVAVFGEEIVTTADPFLSTIQTVSLNPGNAPVPSLIPIPSGAAVGFAGLVGLATVMAFRRRALRA